MMDKQNTLNLSISNLNERPIYAFYDISPLEIEKYLNFISSMTMRDIEFIPCDSFHFKKFGVFYFDSISYLLNFSVTYLYKLLQEEFFNRFVEFFLKSCEEAIGRSPVLDYDSFSAVAVTTPQISEYLLSLDISNKCLSLRFIDALSLCGIDTWGKLTQVSEKYFALNLGILSSALIQNIELIYDVADELRSPHSNKFFSESVQFGNWSQLDFVLESWLDKSVSGSNKERDIEILMKRFGWRTGQPMTLEQIAGEYGGMTRERIRQIEKKWTEKLIEVNAGRRLGPLWILLDDFIDKNGVSTVQDYFNDCSNYFGWKVTFTNKSINKIFEFCPKKYLSGIKFRDEYIISNNFVRCIECVSVIDLIKTYFNDIDSLELHELSKIVGNNCLSQCKFEDVSRFFSDKYFELLFKVNFSVNKEVIYENESGIVYSGKHHKAKFGNIVSSVEQLMLRARKPLHFTELHKVYNQFRPDREISERLAHATLARTPNVVLWSRGTFIHTKWAAFPFDLIRQIEDEVFISLSTGVPAISSFGPFTEYQSQLILQGIPNEIALYSSLKISADPRLSFPHQPYIVLRENGDSFSSLTVILENFVRNYGGLVSPIDINDFAFNKLGIKDYQLLSFMASITNIYGSLSCGYVHECNLNVDDSLIVPLLDYVKKSLRELGTISLKKIFDTQSVLCGLIGVGNTTILGCVLEKNSRGIIEVFRNHRVILSSFSEHKNVPHQIVNYVKSQKRPCSYRELHEQFIKKRGYGEASLNSAFYGDDVYRYISGCVIHGDVLGVNRSIVYEVLEIISCEINDRIAAGEIYASIADVVESRELPTLNDSFYWNETLIADIIDKHEGYKTLGNNKIAFVSDNSSCQSLDELIAHILNSKFSGSENLKKFTDYLSSLRIIDRNIPPSLLKSSKNLCVTYGEISIKASYAT